MRANAPQLPGGGWAQLELTDALPIIPSRKGTRRGFFACNIYTLFDGFTDNTRGYFTSCVVFFRAPQGRGKMRATSKMSASIICKTIE